MNLKLKTLIEDDPFIDTLVLMRLMINQADKAELKQSDVLKMVESIYIIKEETDNEHEQLSLFEKCNEFRAMRGKK